MALAPIPQLPHIQPPVTYVDAERIIALFTPKQHPGGVELHLNLRDSNGAVRRVFAGMTVTAAVQAFGPFVPVQLRAVTIDTPTDFHVRASAIVEVQPGPDGHANLRLSNGEEWTITPTAYAALVRPAATPAGIAAGQI
jgi:hypothetical protein